MPPQPEKDLARRLFVELQSLTETGMNELFDQVATAMASPDATRKMAKIWYVGFMMSFLAQSVSDPGRPSQSCEKTYAEQMLAAVGRTLRQGEDPAYVLKTLMVDDALAKLAAL